MVIDYSVFLIGYSNDSLRSLPTRVDNVQTIKYSVILLAVKGIHETAETKK